MELEITTDREIIDIYDENYEPRSDEMEKSQLKKRVSIESLKEKIKELDTNSKSVGLARLFARLK